MLITFGIRGECIVLDDMDDDAFHTEPVDAPAPFSKSTADVILRSSDGVDFRVKKAIIAEASTFFESMFTLPRLQAASDEHRDGLPVIPMTEDKNTLEKLLRICYPVRDPDIELCEISSLLDAARKYDIDVVMDVIMGKLEAYAVTDSLETYAIAIRHDLPSLAKAAAKHSLEERMDYTPFSELDNISASAYARLLLYRQMCSEAATALCHTFRWIDITDGYAWIDCPSCEKDPSTKRFMFHSQVPVRCWWVQCMNRSAELLQNRPSGKVISSQGWYQQALKEAAACPICIARAVDELPVFAKKFAGKVDEVVAEVQLELE